MKKADIFIIVIYIVLSIFVTYTLVDEPSAEGQKHMVVKVDGQIVYEENLPIEGEKEVPIESDYGVNILKINGDHVRVIESTCPNKICIDDGEIHEHGQILACLPNHMVIEIIGENEDDVDIISY